MFFKFDRQNLKTTDSHENQSFYLIILFEV